MLATQQQILDVSLNLAVFNWFCQNRLKKFKY